MFSIDISNVVPFWQMCYLVEKKRKERPRERSSMRKPVLEAHWRGHVDYLGADRIEYIHIPRTIASDNPEAPLLLSVIRNSSVHLCLFYKRNICAVNTLPPAVMVCKLLSSWLPSGMLPQAAFLSVYPRRWAKSSVFCEYYSDSCNNIFFLGYSFE